MRFCLSYRFNYLNTANQAQKSKKRIVSQSIISFLMLDFKFVIVSTFIILFAMSEQLTLKRHQIVALIDKLMSAPLLQPIPYATIQKLRWNFKNPSIQQLFLQHLAHTISAQKEVILRLKCWTIIHLILLGNITHETSAFVEKLIEHRELLLNQEQQDETFQNLDRYLATQVQLPFILFVKKLAIWKQITLNSMQTDPVSIGFSELNKIKEILQLRKIFHNYSCYYSTHQYALNLFETLLLNIRCLWMSVCIKIKNITLQAIKINEVQESQYLLIKQAQVMQDLLIQFVYCDKLALKLPNSLLIRQVSILKPEMKQLQLQRKRKSSVQTTLGIIKQKKIRKLSTGTVDTNKQARESTRCEQKLDTDRQIQIMDTINEMQILLSFQNQNI